MERVNLHVQMLWLLLMLLLLVISYGKSEPARTDAVVVVDVVVVVGDKLWK